jgi:wobble nucleotide-excising tRNase
LKMEEAALVRLNAQKKRHSESVAALCADYKRLGKEKATLEEKKAQVRAKLEAHSHKVMKPYHSRINQLLDNFNAGFSIAQTKPAYGGGIASSTYQLVINNTEVDLGDGKTSVDQPSFKNTLSAGARSTLALAVFIAHLERDPDRAKPIVVFDDPFTAKARLKRLDASVTNSARGRTENSFGRGVADDSCPACAAPLDSINAAKITAMHSILPTDRKASIVLATVKGEALARRPDSRP